MPCYRSDEYTWLDAKKKCMAFRYYEYFINLALSPFLPLENAMRAGFSAKGEEEVTRGNGGHGQNGPQSR